MHYYYYAMSIWVCKMFSEYAADLARGKGRRLIKRSQPFPLPSSSPGAVGIITPQSDANEFRNFADIDGWDPTDFGESSSCARRIAMGAGRPHFLVFRAEITNLKVK